MTKITLENHLKFGGKKLVDTHVHMNVFVPIQLIISHSIYCDIKYEEQTVYLMCPVRNSSKLSI